MLVVSVGVCGVLGVGAAVGGHVELSEGLVRERVGLTSRLRLSYSGAVS